MADMKTAIFKLASQKEYYEGQKVNSAELIASKDGIIYGLSLALQYLCRIEMDGTDENTDEVVWEWARTHEDEITDYLQTYGSKPMEYWSNLTDMFASAMIQSIYNEIKNK